MAVDKRTFPHSAILTGGCADSRLSQAYEIAQTLFCKVAGSHCGACDQCLKIKAGSHPDFFYIGPEAVKVETAREIKRNASIRPSEAENKIFIIDRCDDMTLQAQNALLKVLEEPSHTYFMLLCNNDHTLLDTIRSRCQTFSVGIQTQAAPSEALQALAVDFAAALPLRELDLCGALLKASALTRQDYSIFLTLCKAQLHSLLTGVSPISRGKLLDIYQYFYKLEDDLVYNPSVFSACTCACSEITEILNR